MYCVNCGVKLADSEKCCPLCGITAFHPEVERPEGEPLYPQEQYPAEPISSRSLLVVLSTTFITSIFITALCDLQMGFGFSWSGYVIGALLLGYVGFVLPFWFKAPNPVIFVPNWFALAAVYLLYINFATGGHWFLSFALPVTGFVSLLVTVVVTLLRYIRRRRLYIFGGAIVLLGLFMPLMGFLLNLTFYEPAFALWSLYPLTVLVLFGGMLIFLAACRPARDAMERKFFI